MRLDFVCFLQALMDYIYHIYAHLHIHDISISVLLSILYYVELA
jgi:hypothetical protein